MNLPIGPIIATSIKSWFSAKGFWLVVAGALLPLVLTGAWVATHQGDLAAESLEWSPSESITENDNVTFTGVVKNVGKVAVGPFNATVNVGRVTGATLTPLGSESERIERLEPGEERPIELVWQARPGAFFALLDVDPIDGVTLADEIGEIDEFNNQLPKPVVVNHIVPTTGGPEAPASVGGDENATETVDLVITELSRSEATPLATRNVSFSATVENRGSVDARNVTLNVRVGRVFTATLVPNQQTSDVFDIAAGETKTIAIQWTAGLGVYWHEAFAQVGAGQKDATPGDNHRTEAFAVDPDPDRRFVPPDPPEKLTIKEFYANILSFLHLRLLIPFIALFYAAGVITDEREKGTLAYVLTRPVPRWMLPVAKFLSSFVVAAVAIAAGLVGTFALLFGTPEGNVGFLTTPLLLSLVSLFAYGCLFVLIGVLVNRPYLVGMLFIIGWETAASIFLPWVRNLTLSYHLQNALGGWSLVDGLQWLPTTDDGMRAFLVLLAAGLGALVASSVAMKRKEFDV